MNFLIIGLGSIGQRHFRNLKKLDKKLIFLLIEKNKSPLLSDDNQVLNKKFSIEKIILLVFLIYQKLVNLI